MLLLCSCLSKLHLALLGGAGVVGICLERVQAVFRETPKMQGFIWAWTVELREDLPVGV